MKTIFDWVTYAWVQKNEMDPNIKAIRKVPDLSVQPAGLDLKSNI